jgi:hypothetical protein
MKKEVFEKMEFRSVTKILSFTDEIVFKQHTARETERRIMKMGRKNKENFG